MASGTRFVRVEALAALVSILAFVCFTIVSSNALASPRECTPVTSHGEASNGLAREIPSGTEESEQGQELSSCPQEFPGLGNFAEVDRGRLYRSAQPTREGLQLARSRFGIRTVISFRAFHSDRSDAEALGLQFYRIPFNAWNVRPEDAVRFLKLVTDPGNHPILVHCQHGADRTGTMVAVYRIFVQGWTTEEAMGELPRFGFHTIWANLKTFLRDEEWRRAAEQAGILRDGLQ